MKCTLILLITLAGLSVTLRGQPKLTIYLHTSTVFPVRVQASAESAATTILRRAAIPVEWRHANLPKTYRGQPIAIEIVDQPARDHLPDEIGFATTSDGVHILVYYGRISEIVAPNAVPNVLAYVIVHEIVHLLQGGGHSKTGIMKAHWIQEDIRQMATLSLDLEPGDLVLAQKGFAARTAESTPRK